MDDRYVPPLVAVLGGGQLAHVGLAGIPLGLGFRFLDPTTRGARAVARHADRRRARRRARAAQTVENTTVVPYEWKASRPTARACSRPRVTRSTRRPTRSRSRRTAGREDDVRELDIPVAAFAAIDELEHLRRTRRRCGLPRC